MAFDKTGTLTQGRLRVAECLGVAGNVPHRVLQLAATAEQSSEHLIAGAILHAARERNIGTTPLAEFQSLPGAGVRARPLDRAPGGPAFPLLVGNRRLHVEHGIPIPVEADELLGRCEAAGLTALLVSEDERVVGVIGVGDTVRPEAREILDQLRGLGIHEFALLSGDRPAAVQDVARSVGIDRYLPELRPAEKANWIADWSEPDGIVGRRELGVLPAAGTVDGTRSVPANLPRRRRCVAMVGDGVNDAPALATADVGIALRSVGSEIAAEAGDVILLGEPLKPLPSVCGLARETVRVIYQNVVLFAFFANFLGIALTAWLMPAWSDDWRQRSPVAAALFHQAGSVLVLLNAMRLLWFERWQGSRFSRLEMALWGALVRAWQRLEPVRTGLTWVWLMRRQLLRLTAMALLLAYLTQIVVFVQSDEVALVKRFGRMRGVLPPGPHLRLPPPFDEILREQPGRVRVIELGLRRAAPGEAAPEAAAGSGVGGGANAPASGSAAIEWNSPHAAAAGARNDDEVLLMTGDRSLVELAVTIQYRVADLRAFRFGSREPERLLKAAAESVVREVVATQPLLDRGQPGEQDAELLAAGRGAVERAVGERLQKRANELGLGVEILAQGICLRDVHPPLAVVDAFRDVSAAYKERERLKNEADAFRRDRLIQAGGGLAWRDLSSDAADLTEARWARLRPSLTGEAFAEISAAEAFAARSSALAEGDAESFLRRRAAYETQPRLTQWRMFMETVGAALAGHPKLLLDRAAHGRRHVLLGVPANVRDSLPLFPATVAEPEEE
jgi:Cu+-exporting ATPase